MFCLSATWDSAVGRMFSTICFVWELYTEQLNFCMELDTTNQLTPSTLISWKSPALPAGVFSCGLVRFKAPVRAVAAVRSTTMHSDQQTAGHQMIPLVGLAAGLLQTSIISTCSLLTPQRAPASPATHAGAGRLDEGLISFPVAHQPVIAEAWAALPRGRGRVLIESTLYYRGLGGGFRINT